MPDSDLRLGSILFDYQTTNKTDYRGGKVEKLVITKNQPKRSCHRPRPPPLKDVHTMSNWKDDAIPFSLLHKPKEILRTNPTHIQKKCERPKDTGLEEAIRTRPRLVMTPAVSMDDIEEARVRTLLVSNMYTSATMKAQREVEKPYFSVRAPLPDLPAPAKPVKLNRLRPPLVSPEWRREGIEWDQQQMRGYCDATREFWLRRDPPLCRKCDESTIVDALRKSKRQMMPRQ